MLKSLRIFIYLFCLKIICTSAHYLQHPLANGPVKSRLLCFQFQHGLQPLDQASHLEIRALRVPNKNTPQPSETHRWPPLADGRRQPVSITTHMDAGPCPRSESVHKNITICDEGEDNLSSRAKKRTVSWNLICNSQNHITGPVYPHLQWRDTQTEVTAFKLWASLWLYDSLHGHFSVTKVSPNPMARW